MKKLFSIALIFSLAIWHSANALVLWGYDNSLPTQKIYRYFFVDTVNNCKQFTRNEDPHFVLHDQIDYMSGMGFKIYMAGPSCVTALDYQNVMLITPRHMLVAIHWGIWNQPNHVFGFMGMDGRLYKANLIPGVTPLVTSAGVVTDLGLVELDQALPPQVVPFHLVSLSAATSLLNGNVPAFNYGNINLALNFNSWGGPGDPNYKGVGTNITSRNLVVMNTTYIGHGVSAVFKPPPTNNPLSTNWNDYWSRNIRPYPPLGTGFTRMNDSGSPTMIKAQDSAGRMRLYLVGNTRDYDNDNYIPIVFADIQAKITAYNNAHHTNYILNNPAPLPSHKSLSILNPAASLPVQ
jgi:hypothetical protein